MAYIKTVWNPGGPPGVSAENLNKMEQGIADAASKADVDAKFEPNTGHRHTGAAGDGPKIPATCVEGLSFYPYLWADRVIPNAGWSQNPELVGLSLDGPRWVAVGRIIVTSDDQGATWIQRSKPGGDRFNDVIWNGSLYVAVGDMGGSSHLAAIMTSPDGITWTLRTNSIAHYLISVAWSGESFVAVGYEGTGCVSLDGVSWTDTSNGMAGWRSVTWMPGFSAFVAVGPADRIRICPSIGAPWVDRTMTDNSISFTDVVWSSALGRGVAVGAQVSSDVTYNRVMHIFSINPLQAPIVRASTFENTAFQYLCEGDGHILTGNTKGIYLLDGWQWQQVCSLGSGSCGRIKAHNGRAVFLRDDISTPSGLPSGRRYEISYMISPPS